MLTARRRLLYMLLVLAIGSGALAVTKMAAWWVVVPPTVMLLGYMGMLREAAKADAERRELARTRATPPRPRRWPRPSAPLPRYRLLRCPRLMRRSSTSPRRSASRVTSSMTSTRTPSSAR